MVNMRFFDIHRVWQDWFGTALGVLIALSPWLAVQTDSQVVTWITIAVGFWVMPFSGLQLVDLERSEEAGSVVCGVSSPFALGYADTGSLMYWHFVLGTVVVLLAVLEFWQDWKLTDKELVHHFL